MPRSIVIYTSRECLADLKVKCRAAAPCGMIVPYTLSFGQRTDDPDKMRVRITELIDDLLDPVIEEIAQKHAVLRVSAADPETQSISYEALLENASFVDTSVTLQFMSPVIINLGSGPATPFPVLSCLFRRYCEIWNSLSGMSLDLPEEVTDSLTINDFALSCRTTAHGIGSQGWMTIDCGRGRTETDIRLFNTLADFSFFAGTGLYTDAGLGQTRRVRRQQEGSSAFRRFREPF
jgi:CRISPR/Cas system endoribonuclease Cas6 (RAMP superfamily)